MILFYSLITAFQFSDAVSAVVKFVSQLGSSNKSNSSSQSKPTIFPTRPTVVSTSLPSTVPSSGIIPSPMVNNATPLPSNPISSPPSTVPTSALFSQSPTLSSQTPTTTASDSNNTTEATSTSTETEGVTKAAIAGPDNHGFWTPANTAYIVVPSSIAIVLIAFIIRRETKSSDSTPLPTSRNKNGTPSPPM